MGGKGDAPAAPNYTGATQLQGELNKENLNTQNYANRPTINTPWGTQSWGTQATVDPSTGQVVTSWTQNNTLAPGLQSALQDQLNIQSGRSQLAGGFMSRVADEYGAPPDYNNLPQMAQASQPTSLQTGTTDYVPGLATSFNFGSPLPQFDASYRDTVANSLMERMQPTHDYQQRQLETKLANMGFHPGTEGYDRELRNLNTRQATERYNALDQAGNEAQRLYNMQMGTAQQGYQQNLGAAQFQNQALNQAQSMDLANMQAGNQAASQQYGLNQQYANAQNQLRQQAIAEMLQRRGTSLNEMNALLNGQQVSMPQMPTFNASGQAQAPDYMGALQNQYNAQLGAYNAQQAGSNALLGAGATLGAAALMGPAGSAGASLFGFSDRRLKANIKRVGTHEIGVGIYEYTMMGMPQRGVIAQEVQAVRPDLVKRHANGYLMVNYGGL